jgi:hypothetical protein
VSKHEIVPGGVVIRRDKPHACTFPTATLYSPGDVFVCSTCDTRWVMVDNQGYQGGPFWANENQRGDGGR